MFSSNPSFYNLNYTHFLLRLELKTTLLVYLEYSFLQEILECFLSKLYKSLN